MLRGVGGGGGGGGRFMITGHIRNNALGCGGGGRWWEIYDNWTHHEECFGVWGGGGEVVGDLR